MVLRKAGPYVNCLLLCGFVLCLCVPVMTELRKSEHGHMSGSLTLGGELVMCQL